MIPVMINTNPVIIPALCSHLCQFNFNRPLYTILIHISIPAIVIMEYMTAIAVKTRHPLVPAKRK